MNRAERRRRTEVVQASRVRFIRDVCRKDSWRSRGYWRNRHPADCGTTRCMCCHGEKVLDLPRRDELQWLQRS